MTPFSDRRRSAFRPRPPNIPRPTARGLLVALMCLSILGLPGRSSAAEGSTYYLSPTGSDQGAGTLGSPWRTFIHAFGRLEPGDTLLVRGGTYKEGVGSRNNHVAARPDAPIKVVAYEGERAVIQGYLSIYNADHWTFDGINVTWDPDVGTPGLALVRFVDGVGWSFLNGEVWGAHSYTGMRVLSETEGEPAGWRIAGNCIHTTYPTNARNNDHNLYVTNGLAPSAGGLVERNILFGAPNGSNIKVGGGAPDVSGAADVTIRYNTMFDAGQNVIVPWRSHHITIAHNLVGRGAHGEVWYPNLRAFENTGVGNVAEFNAGFAAASLIDNRQSFTGIATGDGNRFPLEPEFSSIGSCSGFRPTRAEAQPYGAYSIFHRAAGPSRVETAVDVSRRAFAAGAPAALLVRADAYPDALAGAPLARKLGGPVLLTPRDALHPATAAEVRRLGVRHVVLLGGTAALSTAIEDDLRRNGVTTVQRLGGADRFATAGLVAEQVGGDEVVVAEGAHVRPDRGWPDSVSASALGALTDRPVLLVMHDDVPSATGEALEQLGVTDVTIVGGDAAVSAEVESQLADQDGDGQLDTTVRRIAGQDRYETSARVADAMIAAGADDADLWIATGTNWPDALAAGPAVAATGAVLVLANGDTLDSSRATRAWLRSKRELGVRSVVLVGGTSAIGLIAQDGVARALNGA